MISVVFFGSSQYSLIVLKKLINLSDFQLKAVVTKPDKPINRDQKITPNPVAQFALNHHLPLLQPLSFTADFKKIIKSYKSEIGLCVAYGPPFFDRDMIDIFPNKIINIHPSPLPLYRGATPAPWQIINGETKSAVTFFQIDELPDHGPIISQIPINITDSDTSDSFYQKAFSVSAESLDSVLKAYIKDPNRLIPQDHQNRTYFPKFDRNTAKIDWSWSISKIQRFVRAMYPWPIAWTEVQNQKGEKLKMKIFSFTTEPSEVQIEGKTKTDWMEISKYYSIAK